MFNWVIRKIIGSRNQRVLKKMWPIVREINRFEEELQKQPEETLRRHTAQWQEMFEPFREPVFLAGYHLTRADRETLEDTLHGLEAHYQGIKSLFPDLDIAFLAETDWKGKADEELRARIKKAQELFYEMTPQFRRKEQQMLDEIMPQAFAVVKNAARRMSGQTITVCDQPLIWNMVHFDVQLIGGMALHSGKIAEMATGEGKTLVATLPVYLNALTGRGVHVVTVNDYLARRDSEWMGYLYNYLGLSCGCIQNDLPPHQRKDMYACDVTYGTNSEFGFDYLRDNGMASTKEAQVQRGYFFAIVDEVDSVLIDEARTPLIISGPVTVSTQQFDVHKPAVEKLVRLQTNLSNSLAQEGKDALAKGDTETAGKKYFLCKLGMPLNRAFMRAMEDPETRRLVEKAELSMYNDPQKRELFAAKELLYYSVEEKSHEVDLSEKGRMEMDPNDPDSFTLPDLASAFAEIDADPSLSSQQRTEQKAVVEGKLDFQGQRIHSITQLLRAYCLYEKDVHYVVEENKVVIVDEGTGRKMPGRRWSDGLHQAVEAKENVDIDKETQTLATITIQNYFRLYQKLGGMTGTAETDAAEFNDIYKLDMLIIPTNRPILRKDYNDSIYKTRREKYNSVVAFIKERHDKGQPMLIGTASVDASETLARMLKLNKIPHNVLNAKFHRQEAEIIAKAGQKGAVTVSTNMAGRGTDIKLGPEVAALGGLFVIATERYESRRIDRQLRGRCARQGDPGESKFFLSFEDDLMRNFGAAERMTKMMERFGLEDGQELEHPWLNKSIETAQKRVEQRNYVNRKRILEFDDVMNKQRDVVYSFRNEALESEEPRVLIEEALDKGIPARVAEFIPDPPDADVPADYDGLLQWINVTFPLRLTKEEATLENRSFAEIVQFVKERTVAVYDLKSQHEDPDALIGVERYMILDAVDRLWQEHLYAMDALRDGVYLRAHGQKDPLVEYKKEAYELFSTLMTNIHYEIIGNLFRSATSLQAFEDFLQTLQSGGTTGPQQSLSAPPSEKPKNPKGSGGKGKNKSKAKSATELRPSLSNALAAVSQVKPPSQAKPQTRMGG